MQLTFIQANLQAKNKNTHSVTIILIWTLVGIGCFLRLFHYVDNRSLWIDEIYLNTSILKMGLWELVTQPLLYEQIAPIGVILPLKISAVLLGNNELALRLFPLLCGLASVVLFVPVARHFLGSTIWLIAAVGILALSPPLIYHAVEAKQYSTELLGSVLCLYVYFKYNSNLSRRSLLHWGLWGAIITWFSYSSIFVLTGTVAAIGLYNVSRRDWRAVWRLMLPLCIWTVSFALHYHLTASHSTEPSWLTNWFAVRQGFMPLLPLSYPEVMWFYHATHYFLDYPLGLLWDVAPAGSILQLVLKTGQVVAALLLCGLGALWLFHRNQQLALVLVLPVGLTLLASGLKLYPFFERLTVFLAPLLILLLVLGCEKVATFIPQRAFISYALLILLLTWPFWMSLKQAINPDLFGGYKREYHRENLLYINQQYRPGDVIYIYWNLLPVYRYYKEIYNFNFKAIEGKDVRFTSNSKQEYLHNLKADITALRGKKRVWFLYKDNFFTNVGDYEFQPTWYWKLHPGSGRFFHDHIARTGRIVETRNTTESNISLLDLATE